MSNRPSATSLRIAAELRIRSVIRTFGLARWNSPIARETTVLPSAASEPMRRLPEP